MEEGGGGEIFVSFCLFYFSIVSHPPAAIAWRQVNNNLLCRWRRSIQGDGMPISLSDRLSSSPVKKGRALLPVGREIKQMFRRRSTHTHTDTRTHIYRHTHTHNRMATDLRAIKAACAGRDAVHSIRDDFNDGEAIHGSLTDAHAPA